MAKKQKNLKHKEAVRRRLKAEEEMSKLGLKLNGDAETIGFVFNHLFVSHLTYYGITSINHLCRTYAGIDVCIFSQHVVNPCIQLLCPVFDMRDLIRWDHRPLVSTSICTTLSALSSNADKVYHYAFDPEFIDKSRIESNYLIPAFCDPRVKVITRHESHKRLIETEFNIDVCDTIVPDFDTEILTRLVLTETSNGN